MNKPNGSVDCCAMSSKATPVAAKFVVAGLMLAGWAVSAGIATADPTPAPSPSPSPAAAAAPKTSIDQDGTYAVGTDLVPGIYSSAGPVGGGTCYWKRTGNPDGQLIDNALSKKPQVVQIDAGDKAFKTTGCQTWQLTPDAALPSQASGPQLQGTLGIIGGLLGSGGQTAPQPSQPGPQPSQPAPQP
jgi:hypothetical protein